MMSKSGTKSFQPDQIVIKIGKEISEISLILPLVKQAHKESYFSDLPFDEAQYEKILMNIAEHPGFHGGLYAEYDGVPVAFAYYMFKPMLGSTQSWVTLMHSVYIRSDVRSTPLGADLWERIMSAVRVWSLPRGSKGLMFNATVGIATEETDAVIRSYGGTYLGGNYFMRI